MDITGASCLVTGGASGLGAATVKRLAEQGARVVVVDRLDDQGSRLAADVGGVFIHADVTKTDDVISAVEAAKALGPLRVLVNCAGMNHIGATIGPDGSYESACNLDDFSEVIAVNLIGTFNCIRLAATAMSRTDPQEFGERGVIVNTASVVAFEGPSTTAAYAASKAGIVGMTLPIARDLASVGIRVNTIAPGPFGTPFYDSRYSPDELFDLVGKNILFPKRLGRPDDFARLAIEVITNSFINAETIRIDGANRTAVR